jgi:leucyl-tRNA synthetase
LFDSWYDKEADTARRISELTTIFATEGNQNIKAACDEKTPIFSSEDWKAYSEKTQQELLMRYRLAYQADSWVNWCPALGTVLANDEIVNGVSERGGHPVEKKRMSQWYLRITAYADRLLSGLENIDWSDSLKEQQRNWIGKSTGAMVSFQLSGHEEKIDVFTTRVDTIFGVTFLVIAPEHEFVQQITTPEYSEAVIAYKKYCASKSDIERQQEKEVSGQFTGAHVLHPFTGEKVPVFIADYVLAGYGTGAVMAVPSGDQRDYLFAKKFDLPIVSILDAQQNIDTQADPTKEGKYINSGFINGLTYKDATQKLISVLETDGIGYGKIQFRMRDAGFSRQRYWGEPFPVYYDKDGIVRVLSEDQLPLTLPKVENFKPTADGKSPLANATSWVNELGEGIQRETDTMPAFAGSSWYFLRYMDPNNDEAFVGQEAQAYWQDVDLYVGGTEHAVGHLLYSRFWHKFFKDNNWVSTEEPFKKLLNQGMIGGRSLLTQDGQIVNIPGGLHVPINYASKTDRLYRENFSFLIKTDNRFEKVNLDTDVNWEIDEEGKEFIPLKPEFEKMSKSKHNVVNPDDMIALHGADCFRMFEMFLGPVEAHKPWDTNGIDGVGKFLRRLWRIYNFNEAGQPKVAEGNAEAEELKILHKTIKKVKEDIERFSFNTVVSAFMICVNELSKLPALHRETLETLPVLLSPFAPFTAEVLWEKMGGSGSVVDAQFPDFNEDYLVENTVLYPVSINGKVRSKIEIAATTDAAGVEAIILQDEAVIKYLDGRVPKKVIVVPGRIVNVVI